MSSHRLTKIELFLFDTKPSFIYSPAKSNDPYIILQISCREGCGYGVCQIQPSRSTIDLIKWGAFLKCICSSTLDEALNIVQVRGKKWSIDKQTLLQSALLNAVQFSSQRYLKAASGSTRIESYSIKNIDVYPLNFIDKSLLIHESTSYYSIFVRA